MSEEFKNAIVAVAGDLLHAENAIDCSIAASATTIATMMTYRPATGIAAVEAQPHLDHLLDLMAGLNEQRMKLLHAHGEFGKLAARRGFSPSSHGDWWPCPDVTKDPTGAGRRAPIVSGRHTVQAD